jgi:hypothetical protein
MTYDQIPPNRADLPDESLLGQAWDAWAAAHPAEAAEVEVARRVRRLMRQLASAEIAAPQDFEARLMARIRDDRTLLDLLDLGLSGFGRTLIELINLLLSLLPAPQTQPTAA